MRDASDAIPGLARRRRPGPLRPRSTLGAVPPLLIALLFAAPLEAQGRSSGDAGSAPIRISGGKVRIGNQPAGSLRSFSDRGGLARIIGGRLERAGDPRASRFGLDSDNRGRSRRGARPLRGRYYDPYAYYRNLLYGRSDGDREAYDTGTPMRSTLRAPLTLARAYNLQGPPSYTSIRIQSGYPVGGGYRLVPLRLPTVVVYWPYPVWVGSLFDGRS